MSLGLELSAGRRGSRFKMESLADTIEIDDTKSRQQREIDIKKRNGSTIYLSVIRVMIIVIFQKEPKNAN